MKKFVVLLLVVAGGLASAQLLQTNLPAQKKVQRTQTVIDSDSVDFDLSAQTNSMAVYRGHVVVVDPQMTLKCDQLVVFIPKSGERLNRIEAQTNVVIDFADSHGQTARATGDLAVYRYLIQGGITNETVTMTGNPQVESPQGTLTGEPIVWDRANNRLSAKNQHMKFKQNLDSGMGTNAAPIKLF